QAGNDVDDVKLTPEVYKAAIDAKGAITLRRYHYAIQMLMHWVKRDMPGAINAAKIFFASDALAEFPSIAFPGLFFGALSFVHEANLKGLKKLPEEKRLKAALK